MSCNIIISLDWDHTFRNMTGIDLNILALSLYAKSKHIPVGLTTHRDLENTTLYTLYPWQYQTPQNDSDALAAAISYWDKHLFKPLNLEFDFINARYQPRYDNNNYYNDVLYPLEKKLAEEITLHRILDNPPIVREKIREYGQIENFIADNEFKETQLLWLSKVFSSNENPLTFYHLDDSSAVCESLSTAFAKLTTKTNVAVKTIFYQHSPLFANECCIELLTQIGLLQDIQNFIRYPEYMNEGFDNPLQCLALCLAVLQIPYIDNAIFSKIEKILTQAQVKLLLKPENENLYHFVEKLLRETKTTGQALCIMPNNLSFSAK